MRTHITTKSTRIAAVAVFALLSFPAQAEKLLKINESLGPGSPEELALLHFKKLVEEGSKGEVKIAIHLQDALGKPTQALESLTIGALDLYRGDLADPQRPTARHIDRAIDLRRVAF